jgi:hypothetical protein
MMFSYGYEPTDADPHFIHNLDMYQLVQLTISPPSFVITDGNGKYVKFFGLKAQRALDASAEFTDAPVEQNLVPHIKDEPFEFIYQARLDLTKLSKSGHNYVQLERAEIEALPLPWERFPPIYQM